MHSFLVFGYGIPKDIFKDTNYNVYLRLVFNKIFEICQKKNIEKPHIIFSGGFTDMFKPYKRNEADEMKKFIKSLATTKYTNPICKNWKLISEKKSLSTLENQYYCKDILKKGKRHLGNIYIFCEHSRKNRIKKTSKLVFDKAKKIEVIDFDFDTSGGRYLDPKFIKNKEHKGLIKDMEVITGKTSIKDYRKFFLKKFKHLRNQGPKKQLSALVDWWTNKLTK